MLVLSLVACDGDGSPTTTSSGPPLSTVPTTAAPDPSEPEVLGYDFKVGDTHTYEVVLNQRIQLESEGSSEAVADEALPANLDVTVDAQGTFEYSVAEGPDADTYSVAIEGSFSEVGVSGTADGEPVDDPADIESLGVIQPVSTVVLVDRQGRVRQDPANPTVPMGLGATPLTGLAGDLGQWVGPLLGAEPVEVGATWTEVSEDALMGDEPVSTTVTGEVTGTEEMEGVETLVIASEAATGEATIDLSGFFAEFLTAFADPEDPERQAALADAIEQLVFEIVIEPSTTGSTAWFDPSEGLARRYQLDGSPTVFHMDVAIPDEETGELESFAMELSVTQSIDYTLAGS